MLISFNEIEPKKDRKLTDGISNNEMVYEFTSEQNLDQKKKGKLLGLSQVDSELSAHFFEYLKEFNVPVYFKAKQGANAILVKNSQELPFRVIVRNTARSEFAKQYHFEENTELQAPIYDFKFTDKNYSNLLINESYLAAYGILEADEIKLINKHMAKINAIMKSFFHRRSMRLNEIELRFAKYKGNLLLAHEISSNTILVSEVNNDKKNKYSLKESYPLALYERVIGF
jgi:phosphoribosylaminoimidazole-succinocarboxamide synthase